MATSDILRLTLIANGDEAGTWGATTNTNLGTILEDAIAGYAAVSVTSAAQAFTIVDGAYDQARFAELGLHRARLILKGGNQHLHRSRAEAGEPGEVPPLDAGEGRRSREDHPVRADQRPGRQQQCGLHGG